MTLEAFADNIWIRAIDHAMLGIQLGTRMTIVKLSGGGLFVHSPTRLDSATKAEIDALGEVEHIVAPNNYHHLFAGDFKAAYPGAKLHIAEGLKKKRKDLAFDSVLGPDASPDWAEDLDQLPIEGSMLGETVFFHRATRTVVSADLAENFTTSAHFPTRTYLKVNGIYGKVGLAKVLRPIFRDRKATRRSIDKLLEWDLKQVVISHGDPLKEKARSLIEQTYDWL